MVLRNLVFVICLCFVNILFAQSVDTLIENIQYSIFEDTLAEETTFVFRLKNKSNKIFTTSPFGVNSNKITFYDSKGKLSGYNFIVCGNNPPLEIESDSLKEWKIVALEEMVINPASLFTRRDAIKNGYIIDSLFQFYWQINKKKIGPINYYPEKDLIKKLYDENVKTRRKAAMTLRSMHQHGYNTIREGHAEEHTLEFWEEKVNRVSVGMEFLEISKILEINSEDMIFAMNRTSTYRLDNSFVVNFIFQERILEKVELKKLIKTAIVCELGNRNVRKNCFDFYLNGQKFSEQKISNEGKDREVFTYYEDGSLSQFSKKLNGERVFIKKYSAEQYLRYEIRYDKEKGNYRTNYDKEGKVISKIKVRNRTKRRKYK